MSALNWVAAIYLVGVVVAIVFATWFDWWETTVFWGRKGKYHFSWRNSFGWCYFSWIYVLVTLDTFKGDYREYKRWQRDTKLRNRQ